MSACLKQCVLSTGEKPMMIDFLLWPDFERILAFSKMYQHDVLSSAKLPRLARWVAAMLEVPAVKKTMFPVEVYKQLSKLASEGKDYFDLGLEE